MQFWPANVVTPAAKSGRVEVSDASSNTIIGVLPPSSRFSRFSVLAAAAAIRRPTSILPVKLTWDHLGSGAELCQSLSGTVTQRRGRRSDLAGRFRQRLTVLSRQH